MKEADLVLINGEGTLHNLNPSSLGLLYLAYVARTRMEKPVQVINHSCYPEGKTVFADTAAFRLYKKVYEQLSFVAVREPVSAELMAQMGIPSVTSFDCLPLFIEDCFQHLESGEKDSVVLAGSVAWKRESLSALGTFMKGMGRKGLGIKVLIGADAHSAADDFHFARALQDSFAGRFQLVHATSEAQWLETIASARLLVSGRFHHSIAAAFLNTPFIVMESNTPKIEGLMGMLSVPTRISSAAPDFPERLHHLAEWLLSDPAPGLVETSTRENLQRLSHKNFEGLDNFF